MAAVDYFIKFDGIKGESTDAKHKDEIDVESWSWGETHAAGGPSSGGGGGAGKVAMQDFHFVMGLNRASVGLMKACATGQHIKTATLSARKAGKGQQEYLTFKFHDVLVSSFQTSGSEERVRPDRLGVVQLRQDRGRVQAAEGRRLPRVARRVQVRPEDEQDLLARLGRAPSRGASPRRPPSRAPRPAARGEPAGGGRARPAAAGRRLRVAPNPGAARDRRPAPRALARAAVLPATARRRGRAGRAAPTLPARRSRRTRARSTSSWARSCGRASREPGCSSSDADVVHGAARLVPHDELLIASDHAGAAEAHADHVPGVHRPSVALAHLTVRGQGERALDLCTGNGIQAILLAAHAERVVATDVNERALAYAAFNAALNGVDNVETRPGSFFEPVEGEQFDLVVANPPYVVSPESAYLFRDSGMPGDAVSEHVVRATPAALAPGGFACRPDRVGARSGRPCRASAELAGGLGLRRVPAPHLDGRPDRDRDGVESRSPRPARGLRRRRSTVGSRTTASSGSSSSAMRASCFASAATAGTAGWRRSSCRARRFARRGGTCGSSSRRATGCPRSTRTACSSTGDYASSTTPSSRRTRASPEAAGMRRA